MIRPPKLKPGDKVATISLSWGGAGEIPQRYKIGKERLETVFGLSVVETKHALKSNDWLYQNPEARAKDLMEAFLDPTIKAIICNIGGEDSIRTLPFIDFDIIRKHPKIFIGFSDSTISHFCCYKAGLTSFYGTSLLVGFAENVVMHDYEVENIKRTLFSNAPAGTITPNSDGWTNEHLDWFEPSNQLIKRKLNPNQPWRFLQGEGVQQGRLIGGCLEVMNWLRGTSIWPEQAVWKDAILFLETSEEKPIPSSVKYFLRSLAAMGVLKELNGIIMGRPYDALYWDEYDEILLKILREEGLTDLTVVTGMDFGHTCPTFTLPLGTLAEINCAAKSFSLLESGVS